MDNNVKRTWSKKLLKMRKTATTKLTFFKKYAKSKTYSSTAAGKGFLTTTRIPGNQYVDSDGVVHDYKKYDNRLHNDGISVSIKNIRELIEDNFTAFDDWLVTLTYASWEFDFDKVVKDFERFYNNRLTDYYWKYEGYKFEYLRIIEPYRDEDDYGEYVEGNVPWHIHLILKSAIEGQQLRLTADVIEKKWKHGHVDLEQIYDVDGLAAYFGTVHNFDDIKNKNVSTLTKTEIKQLRWKHYPPERRIFTKSNGIVYPDTETTTEEEKDSVLAENGYETNSYNDSCLLLTDDETGKTINSINYQMYKKRVENTDE